MSVLKSFNVYKRISKDEFEYCDGFATEAEAAAFMASCKKDDIKRGHDEGVYKIVPRQLVTK